MWCAFNESFVPRIARQPLLIAARVRGAVELVCYKLRNYSQLPIINLFVVFFLFTRICNGDERVAGRVAVFYEILKNRFKGVLRQRRQRIRTQNDLCPGGELGCNRTNNKKVTLICSIKN